MIDKIHSIMCHIKTNKIQRFYNAAEQVLPNMRAHHRPTARPAIQPWVRLLKLAAAQPLPNVRAHRRPAARQAMGALAQAHR